MLTPLVSVSVGLGFVALGGINIWLVLQAWSHVKATKAKARMLALHRIGGYLFIAVFCAMTWLMVARLRGGSAESPAMVTIHLGLAMILLPLLFIKVLIARYYRSQQHLLMPIGLTIFVLAFVLIASAAGPYLARQSRVEHVVVDPTSAQTVTIDVQQAGALMERRCSKCHNLDRVVSARKDAEGWRRTVDRMRAMPAAGISDSDAQTIVSYLVSQNRPRGPETAAKMEVARALVDQRCGRCHSLDRVYETVQTGDQWRQTLARMIGYASGSAGALLPGEDQEILEYLAFAQTPDAANRRKAEATEALASTRSMIPAAAVPRPGAPTPASPHDGKTIGFISVIFLLAAGLVIRRPRSRVEAMATAELAPRIEPLFAPAASSAPFILQLVQMTQQTPDSKTLRFAVTGGRTLNAKPGQFLTFSFLFDGKKETRCYSICSSAARSGYVEITPKRVPNGCVSVFLNDRSAVGMTIEATGPFGQFYFDPAKDRNIVLIAGGSGITPMVAMLRYMDDLCLDTHVTLLYFVRTRDDIMFHAEFEEFRTRSQRFRYHVVLSQPDAEWNGPRGHVDREFVRDCVPEFSGRMFFLCGPAPFMDAVGNILTDLGVPADRIRTESFGAAVQSKPIAVQYAVHFLRSGKSASASSAESLLEAAAAAGVDIPSACRQGQCGTCKTRLLEGQVRMTAEDGLDAESKASGFVLPCVARPIGPVTLDA